MIVILTCLAAPFVLLSLPVSPAHDGVRYLLPAFPFAACVMTLGVRKMREIISNPTQGSHLMSAIRWLIAAGAIALLITDLNNPARRPPFELSYYNGIVGGLSGAHKKGYETTYWWEILNDDILKRLNNDCLESTVYFPATPTDLFFRHMKMFNKIGFYPVQSPKGARFMLIWGRPSVGFWESRTFPIYRREGKVPLSMWNISVDSVPLLQLYLIRENGPEILKRHFGLEDKLWLSENM